MGMELHVRTRRDLEPDPEFDPICALFYCLSSDAPLPDADNTQLTGAIVVDKDHQSCYQGENSMNHSPLKKKKRIFVMLLGWWSYWNALSRSQRKNAPAGQVGHLWATRDLRHRWKGAVSGGDRHLEKVCVLESFYYQQLKLELFLMQSCKLNWLLVSIWIKEVYPNQDTNIIQIFAIFTHLQSGSTSSARLSQSVASTKLNLLNFGM